ncbi:hypothetical protein AB0M87_17140 [Streptomyces sp. NPDC051320]|uniref:hypothetical protein n=1 Tax=Streptomyces sp. NPDC051320 TaxID=3154644 RepID=UPI0034444F0D
MTLSGRGASSASYRRVPWIVRQGWGSGTEPASPAAEFFSGGSSATVTACRFTGSGTGSLWSAGKRARTGAVVPLTVGDPDGS